MMESTDQKNVADTPVQFATDFQIEELVHDGEPVQGFDTAKSCGCSGCGTPPAAPPSGF